MPQTTADIKYLEDKNGEVFFPVSHIGAVLDDNGTPLSVMLPSIGSSVMESHTWLELITMRNNGTLVPGRYYRMTDYVTKVRSTLQYARTTGYQFDLILLALSPNQFSERVSATFNEDDWYFNARGANLSAWQIWYTIDNNSDRFDWADNSSLGRGVIYRMIDEWNNDCPYDFKNIMFIVNRNDLPSTFLNNNFIFAADVFTFSCLYYDTIADASLLNYYNPGDMFNCKVKNNRIGPYIADYTNSEYLPQKFVLVPNVFIGTNTSYLGNNNVWFRGFNNVSLGDNCSGNFFGNGVQDVKFGTGCNGNIIDRLCRDIIFGNFCIGNQIDQMTEIITFGNFCDDNLIQRTTLRTSNNISLGNACDANLFSGLSCISISDNCNYLTLTNIANTKIDSGCNSIRFNNFDSSNISIGSGCAYIDISGGDTAAGSNIIIAPGTRGTVNSYYTYTLTGWSSTPRIIHRTGSGNIVVEDY